MKFLYLIKTIFSQKKKPHLTFKSFGNVKDIADGADPKLSYAAITSNNIHLNGSFVYNERFVITATDSSGNHIGYIRLEGHLAKHNGTTFFYLRELRNETENDSDLSHGIGCLLLQMLLTFIANYNYLQPEKEKVKYISGSIDPIGTKNNLKDELELRKYYKKRSGLTDFYHRIQIVIDHEKCEKNNLFYEIKYLN